MWAIFALAAAVLSSFNPILYRRMLTGADTIVVVWGVLGLGLPLLALAALVTTPAWPQVDAMFVVGIGASATLNVVAHLASARSLRLADASLVTPLLTLSPLFTLLMSTLFLGEKPNARGLAGVVIVLVGAYWLTREPGSNWLTPFKSIVARPGIALVLSAALLWAVTPIFEKLAIRHSFPPSPRVVALAVNGLLVSLLTPFVLGRGRTAVEALALRRREWLLAALIAGTAPILGYTAFSLGLVGYVTTLFRLSAIFTVLWGAWLLGESGLRQRLPASILMVIAGRGAKERSAAVLQFESQGNFTASS